MILGFTRPSCPSGSYWSLRVPGISSISVSDDLSDFAPRWPSCVLIQLKDQTAEDCNENFLLTLSFFPVLFSVLFPLTGWGYTKKTRIKKSVFTYLHRRDLAVATFCHRHSQHGEGERFSVVVPW